MQRAPNSSPAVALFIAASAMFAVPASAEPSVDSHVLVEPTPSPDLGPGTAMQIGEVYVMLGDDEIVTSLGGNDYGIDSGTQMPNIGQRFYMEYGDDFDGLAVFTTFPDLVQGGIAYSVSPGWSGATGLGLGTGGAAGQYGSDGKLISVINMNDVDTWGAMDLNDVSFAAVFGQEFTHTWLAFIEFIDPVTMQRSTELLGRDGAHWSAIFESGSSVQDGMTFDELSPGRFRAGPNSTQYGPLDLYAMGVIAPEDVGPLYIIRNATYEDSGQPVNPIDDGWTGIMGQGRIVLGDKFEFSIDDIIAAHGPRVPAWDDDNDDFRVAFILVTRPGESFDSVMDKVDKLNRGRLTWEHYHSEWTDKKSSMCTDLTGACPLAVAQIDTAEVSEDPDDSDMDGIIEPGERVRVTATLTNTGSVIADTAIATLSSDNENVVLPEPETLPAIPSEGSIEHTFFIEIEGDACGSEIEVDIRTQIEHRIWSGNAAFTPGVLPLGEPEQFETNAGWYGNPDGTDAVVNGRWEHGVPDATFFAGRTLQPGGGAGGVNDPAWITGPFDPWDEELEGSTTLESAPYDLSAMHRPTLVYKVWYVALDRENAMLSTATTAHLTVQASNDGGETWVDIDSVSGEALRWETREASLDGLLEPTEDVRVRFIASDPLDWEERIVEVGIDDVLWSSLSTSCADGGGGGCCQTTDDRSGLWLAGLVAVLLFARRRRAL